MKQQLKNSSLGIASFVLSIFAFIFLIIPTILAMTNETTNSNGGTNGAILFIVCAIPSTVMSIIDLAKGNRKKTLAIWALIIDWGLLFISIIITIIFLYVFK